MKKMFPIDFVPFFFTVQTCKMRQTIQRLFTKVFRLCYKNKGFISAELYKGVCRQVRTNRRRQEEQGNAYLFRFSCLTWRIYGFHSFFFRVFDRKDSKCSQPHVCRQKGPQVLHNTRSLSSFFNLHLNTFC